jgi:hypothetical protein
MKQKSLFLTTAVLLGLRIAATAQTPPSYVPADGLVGWWPFNGNANDESGNGNNGTVNGATLTEDRFGNGNAAYGIQNSTDCIALPLIDLSATNSFGLSAWIFIQDFSTEFMNYHVVREDNGFGSLDWLVAFQDFGNTLSFGLGIQGEVYTELDVLINPNDFIGGWHNIVVTYDGSIKNIYSDGILLGSEPKSGFITYTSDAAHSFGSAACGVEQLHGVLDDIAIWGRSLSSEEINDLYNANLCYEYITVTDTLIINLSPTGFNPVTYSNTILMYPNPSNDQLTVDYGDYATLAGYTLKIFNSIGQEIHSANINQQQEVLPLGTWGGAGNYQVVIYNAQGVPVDTRTIVLQ